MSKFYNNYMKKHYGEIIGIGAKEEDDANYKRQLIKQALKGTCYSKKQGSKTLERLRCNCR